ncbi:trihelix transcription factor PTL [Heracleum sosnowskyi]|uniref:Trihelix transcription factor PTL n=1 Tax=Heracleum sosnowskyi TaxID=360622 RepID=A0AAD8N7M1_9APIA|nr:trihelix transcription factor PTL [Heracleum sosnowskyi]
MEDHQHHQYGIADLRHFMNARPTTSTSVGSNLFTQPTAELMNNTVHHHHQLHHSNDQLAAQQHLEMLISSRNQLNSSSDQISPMPTPRSSAFLHHHQQQQHHHHHHQLFRSDSTATAGTSTATLDMDLQMSGGGGNGDGGTGRWPRQETLTLLEIRSRLDPKFKEANQKGPLWDEVSRIMSVDHGYQRSGKKCREKFENLYKYYKKTKEGKAGRQDGKHYRFFRQLEALYGESSSTNPTTSVPSNAHLAGVGVATFPYTPEVPNQEVFHQTPRQIVDDSFTPSNSSAFVTSSSDEYCSDLNAAMEIKRRGKRSWKAKIKDFIDGQMRKLMDKQEVWLEKMMKSIEHKEQERMMREEEWRKQEAARTEREHKFWEKERAWIEARDAGLMEALHKLTGTKELRAPVRSSSPDHADHGELLSMRAAHQLQNQNDNGSETMMPNSSESWPECEITRLIQLRSSMEPMFVQQSGTSEEEVLWEEIASNMACLGYDTRSAAMCKDKWESINNYLNKAKDQSSKKRKENNTTPTVSSSCFYFQNNESICNNQGGGGGEYRENNDLGGGGLGGLELTTSLLIQSGHHHDNASRPPSDSNVASSTMQGSSFRFFMGDQTDNLWENYGLKLSKGDNN